MASFVIVNIIKIYISILIDNKVASANLNTQEIDLVLSWLIVSYVLDQYIFLMFTYVVMKMTQGLT